MKKIYPVKIVLLITMLLNKNMLFGQDVIAELVDPDFPPYHTEDIGYKDFGIVPEIVQKVFQTRELNGKLYLVAI